MRAHCEREKDTERENRTPQEETFMSLLNHHPARCSPLVVLITSVLRCAPARSTACQCTLLIDITTTAPGCCDGTHCSLAQSGRLYTTMMMPPSRCPGRRSCPRGLRRQHSHGRTCQWRWTSMTTLVWCCLIVVDEASQAATQSMLKGISHCHIGGSNPSYTCDDLATLGASWFYTWSATPPQCNTSEPMAEWVPQINSLASATHHPVSEPSSRRSGWPWSASTSNKHTRKKSVLPHTHTILHSH